MAGQREQLASSSGGTATATATTNAHAVTGLRSAAETASYDMSAQADAITQAWEKLLRAQTKAYQARLATAVNAMQAKLGSANGNGTGDQEIAEPNMSFFGIVYPWWNVLLAGPFQPIAPGGPFLPRKVIRAGEPAFMIAALWRNPAPLPGGPNPSAAQIMSPYNFRVSLPTINLSTVVAGPPVTAVNGTFGGGFLNFVTLPLPTLPVPAQGSPQLYEANLVADITGPGAGLPPFAGFSTWLWDPDVEPPFWFVPGAGGGLQHDIPARYLVYA